MSGAPDTLVDFHTGRTLDPAEATLFFVPAYLTANKKRAGHEERLDGLVAALKRDPYFQKNGGRDHVFGYSSWNPGVAKGIGLWPVWIKILRRVPTCTRRTG